METGAPAVPVVPAWVLGGTPLTRSWHVVSSHDRTSNVVVWECTAGRFEWHYTSDEAVVIVSGEVFITNEKGEEQRFGPGDLAFFPSGSSAVWRVPERVRKIAVLRQTMWPPFGFVLRAWNKLMRISGLKGPSPL
jgi:uncharacterized cupin superfamily protein